MHKSTFCEIFYEMFEHFYQCYGDLICTVRDDFVQERGKIYSREIENFGAPLDRFVGFIDGTNIFISKSKDGEAKCYLNWTQEAYLN